MNVHFFRSLGAALLSAAVRPSPPPLRPVARKVWPRRTPCERTSALADGRRARAPPPLPGALRDGLQRRSPAPLLQHHTAFHRARQTRCQHSPAHFLHHQGDDVETVDPLPAIKELCGKQCTADRKNYEVRVVSCATGRRRAALLACAPAALRRPWRPRSPLSPAGLRRAHHGQGCRRVRAVLLRLPQVRRQVRRAQGVCRLEVNRDDGVLGRRLTGSITKASA